MLKSERATGGSHMFPLFNPQHFFYTMWLPNGFGRYWVFFIPVTWVRVCIVIHLKYLCFQTPY